MNLKLVFVLHDEAQAMLGYNDTIHTKYSNMLVYILNQVFVIRRYNVRLPWSTRSMAQRSKLSSLPSLGPLPAASSVVISIRARDRQSQTKHGLWRHEAVERRPKRTDGIPSGRAALTLTHSMFIYSENYVRMNIILEVFPYSIDSTDYHKHAFGQRMTESEVALSGWFYGFLGVCVGCSAAFVAA